MMQMQGYGYGYAPAPALRQEYALLAEQGVQVTTARFVVGHQTYPIGGITSVAPFTVPAANGGLIAMGVIAVCVSFLMVLACIGGGGAGCYVALLVFAATAGGFFYGASRARPTFGIVISTAGMNVRALFSRDGQYVGRVLAALNQAIATR